MYIGIYIQELMCFTVKTSMRCCIQTRKVCTFTRTDCVARMDTRIHVHVMCARYVCIHVCVCVCVYIYVCINMHTCIHTYMDIHICMYIHTYIHTYIHRHIYVRMHMHVYVFNKHQLASHHLTACM